MNLSKLKINFFTKKFWTKKKLKHAEFNCPFCGKYYKYKHFKQLNKKHTLFCKCNEIMIIYINDNEVTNISIL